MPKARRQRRSQAQKTRPKSVTRSAIRLDAAQPLNSESPSPGLPTEPTKRSTVAYLKAHWIALLALLFSIPSISLGVLNYQLTKPHIDLADLDTKLSWLEDRLDLLKVYFDSKPTELTLQERTRIIEDVELLRNGAGSARNQGNYPKAELAMKQAHERIDEFLPSRAPFQPGQVTVSASPWQGWAHITVDDNVHATTPQGEPVDTIIISARRAPDYAYDNYVNVLTLDIEPTGTTFSQPVELRFSYLTKNVPKDVAETDLIIGMWDEQANSWVLSPGIIDAESHSITTSVDRLGLFAVLAPRYN